MRIVGTLLLLGMFAAPATGRPAAARFTFHVRITLAGEPLVDRDMVWMPPLAGESYQRRWTSSIADPCLVGVRAYLPVTRGITVSLDMPRPVRGLPPHVFMLTASVPLPSSLRGRDGACAANAGMNELRLSQVVVLNPGQSMRFATEEQLVVEVTWR